MLLYLLYIILILTVAMAAGGVILTSRLQKKYSNEIFSPLLYFQVFIYTFGFYGLWGQVLIRAFLPQYISADVLSRLYDIALLPGLPFLVFAWLMILKFSSAIYGTRRNNWFVFGFLLINISVIIIIGYLIGKTPDVKPLYIIKQFFIILNFVYTSIAALQVYYSGKGSLSVSTKDKRIIAAGILIVTLLQSSILIVISSEAISGILFIIIFFAGNTFLPLYLTYGAELAEVKQEQVQDISLEAFCLRYEVSPRESDIIREICKGLSNKEISEKLFISLQTVKDHTHRIYIKTNVRSRLQLMNLVNEAVEKTPPLTPGR
jgi:DNA-binding CsgD family transcriptional regulator